MAFATIQKQNEINALHKETDVIRKLFLKRNINQNVIDFLINCIIQNVTRLNEIQNENIQNEN